LTLAPPYDKLSDSLENIDTPVLESLTLHKASFDCFLGMSDMASLLRRAYGSSKYLALRYLTLRSVDFSGPELSDVIKHLPTITHVWIDYGYNQQTLLRHLLPPECQLGENSIQTESLP